jgi:hypothetical protein
MTLWQPATTAPKTEQIDVFVPGEGRYTHIRWAGEAALDGEVCQVDMGWWGLCENDEGDFGFFRLEKEFTHWMYPPADPED